MTVIGSTPGPIATANPLIPSDISTKCQQFLRDLNSDNTISACTAPLVSALSLFVPKHGSISYSASSGDVQSSLDSLCSSPACEDVLIRSTLNSFQANCTAELQASQPVVLGQYDSLYALQPFRASVCAKDAEDGYCLVDIAEGKVPTGSVNASSVLASSVPANSNAPVLATDTVSSNSTQAIVQLAVQYTIQLVDPAQMFITLQRAARRLLRRQSSGSAWSSAVTAPSSTTLYEESTVPTSSTGAAPAAATPANIVPALSTTGILPNAPEWSAHSVPFLFLSPNMSSSVLCTQCTKTVLASYISWESRLPYAIGLVNSPLLGQQGSLWTGIGDVCGSGFLASTATQAGQQASLTGIAPGTQALKGATTALVALAAAYVWLM